MVSEWKIIQDVYHKTTEVHGDELDNFVYEIVKGSDILDHALEYFRNKKKPYVYPSKSYIVAIVYADYINQRWPNEDFYDLLDDPSLLYNNDDFFKIYSKDPHLYDILIDEYKKNRNAGMLPDIREWAKKEFMDDKA